MTENTDNTPKAEVTEAQPKVMCHISKEMVPINQTVELPYGEGKTFRVQTKYVRFPLKPGESPRA